MKVLASSLTPPQIDYLSRAREGRFTITPYCQQRMAIRNITHKSVLHCATFGILIEFSNDMGTRRTLWRDMHGVCIVLDLDTRSIITAYHNWAWDNHITLDAVKYDAGPVPESLLKGDNYRLTNPL